MTLQTFQGAGALYQIGADGNPIFRGTCFSFRKTHIFLTAAHCVSDLNPVDLMISSPFAIGGRMWSATGIRRHRSADLAVVEVEKTGTAGVRPFYSLSVNPQLGDGVAAIGYPDDVADSGERDQPGRYFRSHIQRFCRHRSAYGYEYHALELGMGSPAGLSGGPVFMATEAKHLVGVVCENFESSTYLSSIEETDSDGKVYREKVRNVINYATCVCLPQYERWLSEHAAPEF